MNRIKKMREEFGYTQQDLANRLNGSKSVIGLYESETRKPSLEILIKLSEIFNCSIDYLLCKTDIRNTTISMYKIPILNTIKANYDWLSKENVIGYVTDKRTIKNYEKNINEYFALKVTGESMLPLLDDGDIVIFHKQDNIETGQTAIIIIEDDEAIIRKIIKTSEGIELHAMNPYYPIRRFTFAEMEKKSIKIVGRVKEANIKKAFE